MMNVNYVLITPARNEDRFIERTIKSILAQTVLPKKWIIVSDGSKDRTDEIVKKYAATSSIITFINTLEQPDRSFGSKVAAFNLGLENLQVIEYDFIGNLDADISFSPDYYEQIINKFRENPKLGIAGGVRKDIIDGRALTIKSARNSVAGGFQLFRKKCFDDIGGYMRLEYGGIDAVAEISARMLGWEVESFTDIVAEHHKPTGSAAGNIFKQKYRAGIKFYLLGYPPIFPLIRFGLRLKQKPIILGSLISIIGYYWAWLLRFKRPVSDDFVKFLRMEQKIRILNLFLRKKNPLVKT
jgi:glycosyltransferase involved in cell wall biosynthesis